MWTEKCSMDDIERMKSDKSDFENEYFGANFNLNKSYDLSKFELKPLSRHFDINSSANMQEGFKSFLSSYLISNLSKIGIRYFHFEKEFHLFFQKYISIKRIEDNPYTEYYLTFPKQEPFLIGVTFENFKRIPPLKFIK